MRIITLIAITFLVVTSKPFFGFPVEPGSNQSHVSLEIIYFCNGMCGARGNKVSIRVDSSKRAGTKSPQRPTLYIKQMRQ